MSGAITCPKCKQVGCRVVDSRASGDGVRRRRLCNSCKFRFSTMEEAIGGEGPRKQVVDIQAVAKRLDDAKMSLLGKERPKGIRRIVFTAEMDAALRSCHKQGLTLLESGEIVGVDASVIARRKRELGIDNHKPWARHRSDNNDAG